MAWVVKRTKLNSKKGVMWNTLLHRHDIISSWNFEKSNHLCHKIQWLKLFLVDCKVSKWEEGECSASCGGGNRTKTRTVVQPALNGGTCPELTEVEACNLEGCKGRLIFQRKQLHLTFLLNIQSTVRLRFGPIGVSVTQTAEEEPRPRPGEFSKKQRMEGQHVPD